MKAVFTQPLGVVLLALTLACGARAQQEGRSPFLPPSASAESAASDPNALQLRGIMSTSSGVKYNIFDPAHHNSVWVGLNEPGNGFLIKSADARKDAVTVASNGQQTTLELKESHVQTPAANGVPQGGAVLRPTPADEQLRLQAVADEVRRRRLLREQAAGTPPGEPGAVAPGVNQAPPGGAVNPDGSGRKQRRRQSQ